MINLQELQTQLAELPNQIRLAQLDYVGARDISETSKLRLKVAHSMALISAKGSNATEKSSQATVKTENEALELIKAQTEEAKKEAEFVFLTNKFISYRKIASLTEQEMKSSGTGF